MSQNEMTVYDHIDELRKRLMLIVVFFLFAIIASFFLAQPLIKLVHQASAAEQLTLNAFRVTDALKVYMQMTFLLALLMVSPLILYQLWSFISPGLLEKERKVTLEISRFCDSIFDGSGFLLFHSVPVCD